MPNESDGDWYWDAVLALLNGHVRAKPLTQT